MNKLSELCNLHIKRLNPEYSDWIDFVVIQNDSNKSDMILVYFISEDFRGERVVNIVWFDKRGKIFMIDGRFSLNFYGPNCIGSKILKCIIDNEQVVLDIEESLKIENVFDSMQQFKGEKDE